MLLDSKYYSVREIAELFNVQEQLVYKWISQGKLSAGKLGGSVFRVGERDLMNFYNQSFSGEEW